MCPHGGHIFFYKSTQFPIQIRLYHILYINNNFYSPVATPTSEIKSRPRTSMPRTEMEELIQETGNIGPHSRGAWSSRPLSAGPFHRPNLPEVNTMRVLADSQLPAEDPAVPLIDSIKKELTKFSAD